MAHQRHVIFSALGALIVSAASFAATPQAQLVSAYQKLGTFTDQGHCSRFSAANPQAQSSETAQTKYVPGLGPAFERVFNGIGTQRTSVVSFQQGNWIGANWTSDIGGFLTEAAAGSSPKPDLTQLLSQSTGEGFADGAISPGLVLLYGGFPEGLDPTKFRCALAAQQISCTGSSGTESSHYWLNAAGQITRSKRSYGTTVYCDYAPTSMRLAASDLALPIPDAVMKTARWQSNWKASTPEIIAAAAAGDKAALTMMANLNAAYALDMDKLDLKLYTNIIAKAAQAKIPGAAVIQANIYTEDAATQPGSPARGMSVAALRKKRIDILVAAASACDAAALRTITRKDFYTGAALERWENKEADCNDARFVVLRKITRPTW